MLDLSFWEIIVIIIACVIFLKPEDVPDIMRQAGRFFRKIKSTISEFTSILEEDKDSKDVVPRNKVLGLDGEFHDAYEVKEVFPEDKNDK